MKLAIEAMAVLKFLMGLLVLAAWVAAIASRSLPATVAASVDSMLYLFVLSHSHHAY